jgi:glycosyltransferase involved in cell wall biosynthesis
VLNILYLSFYFEPDLSAGSFRNTALAKTLAAQVQQKANVHVITTQPNRYKSFSEQAQPFEQLNNLSLNRITVPGHQSGFADQVKSYWHYYKGVYKIIRGKKYDLVFVSSSRLFSAYLGSRIAKKQKCPLYLDIRDLFVENMKELIKSPVISTPLNLILPWVEKKAFENAIHINMVSEGFIPNFKKYTKPKYTYFSNGIDDEFIGLEQNNELPAEPKTIVYAGNFGEGQGLEKIIPLAAQQLGNGYKFLLYGDGGTKQRLLKQVATMQLTNVAICQPIKRKELLEVYKNAHFLFLHLNNLEAFKKVLPSKLFEYGATNIPIIAGLAGHPAAFLQKEISNILLFEPCNVDQMVQLIKNFRYTTSFRNTFVQSFNRKTISNQLAESIASYLPQ